MTDTPLIYHNPRCSKSRETLALLREHGVEPRVVLYLDDPPDATTLAAVLGMLDQPPAAAVRFKEDAARELGLQSRDQRSIDEWARLIADNPILLERPLVVHGGKARIGRPPEAVMALFTD